MAQAKGPEPPMSVPPADQLLAAIVERKQEQQRYKEELETWIADLELKKKNFTKELESLNNKMSGCEGALLASYRKLAATNARLAELDEREDTYLDQMQAPTRAWQWAAAAERARRPEAREFLALMAAHRQRKEALSHQEHQVPPVPTSSSSTSSSSKKRPLPPGLKMQSASSSHRPVSPPKEKTKKLATGKGAYVD